MIPLRDNLPKRRVPLATLMLVGLNGYVFWKEFRLGPWGDQPFILYPHARILTLLPIGFFVTTLEISALFVLGFWIVVQALNGVMTFDFDGGGAAWIAHIGGCTLGLLSVRLFHPRVLPRWTAA